MVNIPEELAPVFDAYRGKGIFTTGGIAEYVRRHKIVTTARSMNAYDWIGYCVSLSEKKGYLESVDRNEYINENYEFWLDVWSDARDGYVHFCHKWTGPFVNEKFVEVYKPLIADYSNNAPSGKEEEYRFDLVKMIRMC